MSKTLKICLAMGGGVSLGSFSGSALTEALKLLILYGQDANGDKYDDIVVDGMSGASAGAIALTVMLKTLIDYKSMMTRLENVTEESILEELIDMYFEDEDEAKNHPKIEELKALQVAQKLQEELWVNRLNAVKLFGKEKIKDFKPNISESFALLDRGLLEDLAKEFIIDSDFTSLENIKVLDKKRVPFACSLTNLLPIEIKKDESRLTQLEKNVIQSTGSQNHTEVRVMDFVFKEDSDKPTDKKWLKFSIDEDEPKRQFDLNSKKAWSIVCASALACGAFPFAFEPVILKRYREEFDGEGDNPNGQWPVQFNELNKTFKTLSVNKQTSVFNEKDSNVISYNSFNFPYVDGGTFNNEPIKEAYRIGAFQDFNNKDGDSDRLVLFVDPIVRTDKYQSFLQSSLFPVHMDKAKVKLNGEFKKLFGVTSSLIGALKNQGEIKEEHKISDVSQNLHLRKTVFNYLNQTPNIGENLYVEILVTAYDKVKTNLNEDIIPAGTRNAITYFKYELRKTCISNNKPNSECLFITDEVFELFIDKITNEKDKSKRLYPEYYDILGLNLPESQDLFARTVFKIIFDFSLNTDGKNEQVERVAILPLNSIDEVTRLPGEEISAFGGFASKKAREYAFHYGRLSTLNSLSKKPKSEDDKDDYGFRKKVGKDGHKHPFIHIKNKNALEKGLVNNINDIKFFDSLVDYENDIRLKLVKLGLKRIAVLGRGLVSRAGLFKTAFYILFTLLCRILFVKRNWFLQFIAYILNWLYGKKIEVTYRNLDPVTISIISDEKINSKIKITTINGDTIRIKKIRNEFLNYSGRKVYQYLFHLYKADCTEKMMLEFQNSQVDSNVEYFNNLKTIMGLDKINKAILTFEDKVRLPIGIDRNIETDVYDETIESSYKKIIATIKVGKHVLPSVNEALTDDSEMLFHSFKNVNYHLNPLIEFDLNNSKKGWYFKENTEALYKKFLRPNSMKSE